jgi:capsular polysaccharide export protein
MHRPMPAASALRQPGPLGAAARWVAHAAARAVSPPPTLAATSAELCADPGLAALLGRHPALALGRLPEGATVLGWGHRPSGRRAIRLAARTGARLLLVEEGFLRSADPAAAPLSWVFDDTGIYYDASRPSRLERLVADGSGDPARARALIRLWQRRGLSKVTGLPPCAEPLPPRYVLLLDQIVGDASVAGGLAHPGSFDRMLQAARIEFPRLPLVLKSHPAMGRRRCHFNATRVPRVIPLTQACDPAPLIAGAEAVYTVTSQGGFEALIHGRPVRCFGMPFYAGWGLTLDDLPTPRRRTGASLEALVHAALAGYPRYIDPDTGAETTAEATMDRLARRPPATY